MDVLTPLLDLRDLLRAHQGIGSASLSRQTLNTPGVLIVPGPLDSYSLCASSGLLEAVLYVTAADLNEEDALRQLGPLLSAVGEVLEVAGLPVTAPISAELVPLSEGAPRPAFKITTNLTV